MGDWTPPPERPSPPSPTPPPSSTLTPSATLPPSSTLPPYYRRLGREARQLARGKGCLLVLAGAGLLLSTLLVIAFQRATLIVPPATVLITTRDGQFLAESPGEALGFWPLSPVPPRVVAATLALEDRRFYSHPGVDPIGIARAAVQNLEAGRRVSGASTIAMQIARLQHPGERNLWRKGLEALTALMLTLRHGREALLAHYLRIVPYGNRYHGIAYAARRYLEKPVEDLSYAEIAFLAALPQAPSRMNPYLPEGRAAAVSRGQRILTALNEAGTLPLAELTLARHELSRLTVVPKERRSEDLLHVVFRLSALAEAQRVEGKGGWRVTSVIDPELQARVADLSRRHLSQWEPLGAGNIAVMAVDLASREVKVALGSTGYFDRTHSGAIDFSRVPRYPGSTLKPFLYALSLERRRMTPATILDDLARGPEGMGNADEIFLGPMLPRYALANSRNVPSLRVLEDLGLETGYDFLKTLGLHDGTAASREYGLSIAVGGFPTTLEQLMRAYTVLAGDGRLGELVWYLEQDKAEPSRVLREETVREVSLFLSDPNARLPTFPRMGASEYDFPAAVKTGTSTDFRDAWTFAWSTRTLVGVWVGHPAYRPMMRVSGYTSAALLAKEVLALFHPDATPGQSDLTFPPPRGAEAVRLCPLSGKLASPACEGVVLEWLQPDERPSESCTVHRQVAVDARDGSLATLSTPRNKVVVKTFVDLPPRYAEWASSRRLPILPEALRHQLPERTGEAPSPLSASEAESLLTAGREVHLEITSPRDGVRIVRDPEIPWSQGTVALQAIVSPAVPEILWEVDGRPYRLEAAPYTSRWIATPGRHEIEATVPFTPFRSRKVVIRVE